MSAAIHPFPGRNPNQAVLDPTHDLLAELAAAVGGVPVAAGDQVALVGQPVRRATVHPIARARRGGANDLVTSEAELGGGRRRHHLALVVMTAAMAVVVAMLTFAVGAFAEPDIARAGSTVVEGGDSLWGIAEDITPPQRDVRETVALILELNDFDSPSIQVGMVVQLPDLDA